MKNNIYQEILKNKRASSKAKQRASEIEKLKQHNMQSSSKIKDKDLLFEKEPVDQITFGIFDLFRFG